MKRIVAIFACVLILVSCHKDKVTQQTINGMVYNQCTDSGLAGVTVYLNILKDNSTIKSYQVVSGTNGNFTFGSIDIHSDTKYMYALNIPSKSGISSGPPTETRFDGTSLDFTKTDINNFFKLHITPGFLLLDVYYTTIATSQNDSIIVAFNQATFHSNVPNLPHTMNGGAYGNLNSQSDSYSNYPMGKYNITIDKWKSGIHTTTMDSIYLGWAATKTYTINW